LHPGIPLQLRFVVCVEVIYPYIRLPHVYVNWIVVRLVCQVRFDDVQVMRCRYVSSWIVRMHLIYVSFVKAFYRFSFDAWPSEASAWPYC
jgi:hypothetical protein